MARPYDLLVRFLVTQGFDDVDLVNTRLKECGLQPILADEFDDQFNIVHDNIPKSISDQITNKKYHGEFYKWMKVLEVDGLWSLEKTFIEPQNAPLKLIYDLGMDPKLKLALQALITKGEKDKEICQLLNLKFSYMLKDEHIALYRKYFWSPGRMTRADWRNYLRECEDYEKSVFFVVLTEPLNVVKTLLDLPSKADITGVYNKVFTQCAQKVEHYMRLSSKETNAEARQWISTMLTLGDKIKKYETGDIEDFSKTIQLEFDFVQNTFPTPDEQTIKEFDQKKQEMLDLQQQQQ